MLQKNQLGFLLLACLFFFAKADGQEQIVKLTVDWDKVIRVSQFPSVSMVDWTSGKPNARFWVLKTAEGQIRTRGQIGRDCLHAPRLLLLGSRGHHGEGKTSCAAREQARSRTGIVHSRRHRRPNRGGRPVHGLPSARFLEIPVRLRNRKGARRCRGDRAVSSHNFVNHSGWRARRATNFFPSGHLVAVSVDTLLVPCD
jgi:hypothetical protein